jgi:hypothetical protein
MSKKLKQNSAWYPSTSQPDDRVLNRADIPESAPKPPKPPKPPNP